MKTLRVSNISGRGDQEQRRNTVFYVRAPLSTRSNQLLRLGSESTHSTPSQATMVTSSLTPSHRISHSRSFHLG